MVTRLNIRNAYGGPYCNLVILPKLSDQLVIYKDQLKGNHFFTTKGKELVLHKFSASVYQGKC